MVSDGERMSERVPRRGLWRTLLSAMLGAALRPSASLPLVADHARGVSRILES